MMPGTSGTTGSQDDSTLRDSSQYEMVAVIGNGAYGTVYRARDKANAGQMVAMKKVRVTLGEEGVPPSTLREICLLKHLERFDHPNIVRLLDVCHGPVQAQERQLVIYLVFEHVDQDLSTYLDRCPPPGLSPERIREMMYQILQGVDFLHSHRIIHRDLKPQNVLVTNNGQVKLADFGLAKIYDFSMRLTTVVVTLWYRAPEVLLGTPYSTAVDLWSCGCIFAELFRRQPLFCGQTEGDQLGKIFDVIGQPPESKWPQQVSVPWTTFRNYRPRPLEEYVPEICPEGKDLLEKLICFDPTERITAADTFKHPYFRDRDFQRLTPQLCSVRSIPMRVTPPYSTEEDSGHCSEGQPEK